MDKVRIHWVTDAGWVHTHGMEELDLPELEIRDCPSYLGKAAVQILRDVCDYMVESGRAVKAGDNFGLSEDTVFSFAVAKPFPDAESHYEVERLQIVEMDIHVCDECARTAAELN